MTPQQLYAAFAAHLAGQAQPRCGIVCAFSGGSDSVVLLHLLRQYCAQEQLPLAAVHINHGLRENAERDEAFCRAMCGAWGIPFFAYHIKAAQLAAKSGMSIEQAARQGRYEALRAFCAENEAYGCIATAHHMDDVAETVLYRLARGSGTRGMTPLRRCRPFSEVFPQSGKGDLQQLLLLRPLLSFSKVQLCAYAEQCGLSYVTDETNASVQFARNRIRAEVLPALSRVNGGASRHIAAFSALAAQDEDFFAAAAERFLRQEGAAPYSCEALLSLHPALSSRVLGTLCFRLSGSYPSLEKTQQMLAFCKEKGAPRTILLPQDIRFVTDGTLFFLESGQGTQSEHAQPEFCRALHPGRNDFPEYGFVIFFGHGDECFPKTAQNEASCRKINKMSISTVINSDKLNGTVLIKSRAHELPGVAYRTGGHTHTVKKALSQNHVPPLLRQHVPLFCDDGGIFWVPFCSMRDDVNPALAEAPQFLTISWIWKGIDYDTK